ncbi:hypothetical protein FQZ97_1142320 [compost metagenome]
MAHLHARGLLHGDLYAHNILWHAQDGGRLGDFGAGWMTGALDPAHAKALQGVEMRAFGCLLEELAERCVDAASSPLTTLAARCLQPEVAARPLFAEVLSVLDAAAP